jgi:ElaB/YqjD/DUF883 family membrane-anchored ribosome-binding protein
MTQKFIKENPLTSMGIAFGGGILIASFMGMMRKK